MDHLRPPSVRRALLTGVLALVVAAAAACAVDPAADGPTQPQASRSSAPDVREVPALAKQVPSPLRTKGVLRVATSSSLPPMTFVADDNATLVGLDVDMAKAVAATLGLRADVTTAGFDTLVPGLQAGRFDMVMSSMGVTAERQRVVDFVDYYYGGQGFLASKSSGFAVTDLRDLCGKRVAVQTGSTQQSTLEDSRALCAEAGRRPYELQAFPDTNAAVLAIRGNRVDVFYASISVVAWTADQNKAFRIAGRYKRAMVGAALPKATPLTRLVQLAVQHLIDDGTYRTILDQWGLADNAVRTARVNSAAAA
ncbi:ABC transporter substrate-binding protein [Cryptosporangium sp. NPDC048952]|uniref:ABC transporter substrate-binding protein n=1 Tax=Cryptosporangium sp. NPDC048952 TaxID=3363961 RepID=UPI003721C96F